MTKSRKKILLSSIAMLLVALVALGSATYAWFTVNRQVTAKNMQVTAATSAGLQITGNNGTNWVRDYSFKAFADDVIAPVSHAYTNDAAFSGAGYYPDDVIAEGPFVADTDSETEGLQPSAGSWKSAALPTGFNSNDADGDAKAKTGYFAAYRVGIRSSNETESITGVQMDINFAANEAANAADKSSDFIRVVVIDETANKIVANIGEGAADTKAVTAVSGSGATATATIPDTANQSADVKTVTGITAPAAGTQQAPGTPKYYTIYMWYEGQDAECVNDHQGLSGKFDIKFSF